MTHPFLISSLLAGLTLGTPVFGQEAPAAPVCPEVSEILADAADNGVKAREIEGEVMEAFNAVMGVYPPEGTDSLLIPAQPVIAPVMLVAVDKDTCKMVFGTFSADMFNAALAAIGPEE